MACANLRGLGAGGRVGWYGLPPTVWLYKTSKGFQPGQITFHQRTAARIKNTGDDWRMMPAKIATPRIFG
jgi:hypothetical protein